jgi:DNA-binding PadR family transcriptional regulator
MRASSISPEYVLLGFLAQEPTHGYDLHLRIEKEFEGTWNVSQSQCYNILKRLEQKDLIRSEVRRQEAAPAKRLLELTPQGRERFLSWLSEPTPASVRAIRIELITRLFFAQSTGMASAQQLIEEQKPTLIEAVQRLRRAYEATPASQKFQRMSLLLRSRQLQSCVDWLDECKVSLAL